MWHIVVTLWLGAHLHVYALPGAFSYPEQCSDRIERIITGWHTRSHRQLAEFACLRRALRI